MGHESSFHATGACGQSYRVGQDRAGRWLAMEVNGLGGGMFATREAALRYAMSETMGRPGAVIVSTEFVGFV